MITIPSSWMVWRTSQHEPLSKPSFMSLLCLQKLEKATLPKPEGASVSTSRWSSPANPGPPCLLSFFFMASGPTDVSYRLVVPGRLIPWPTGPLTQSLQNYVMWIRTLTLCSKKLYTCLEEDPCLHGVTLATAFISASKSRRATSNPGRRASARLSPTVQDLRHTAVPRSSSLTFTLRNSSQQTIIVSR